MATFKICCTIVHLLLKGSIVVAWRKKPQLQLPTIESNLGLILSPVEEIFTFNKSTSSRLQLKEKINVKQLIEQNPHFVLSHICCFCSVRKSLKKKLLA